MIIGFYVSLPRPPLCKDYYQYLIVSLFLFKTYRFIFSEMYVYILWDICSNMYYLSLYLFIQEQMYTPHV